MRARLFSTLTITLTVMGSALGPVGAARAQSTPPAAPSAPQMGADMMKMGQMEMAPMKMSCPDAAETAAPLPPELAGWRDRGTLTAATDPAGLDAATLTPGHAVTVTLAPTPAVHYLTQPEKPGGTVSSGGMLALTVAQAGRYAVALDSGAWVDVLRGKEPVISTAHGHGPACSGIAKMVTFPLTPGHYILQLAASGAPQVTVLVAPLP